MFMVSARLKPDFDFAIKTRRLVNHEHIPEKI